MFQAHEFALLLFPLNLDSTQHSLNVRAVHDGNPLSREARGTRVKSLPSALKGSAAVLQVVVGDHSVSRTGLDGQDR